MPVSEEQARRVNVPSAKVRVCACSLRVGGPLGREGFGEVVAALALHTFVARVSMAQVGMVVLLLTLS